MLIAANPDPESRLPYLIRIPAGTGLVFATSGTWPRTKALYCHPLPHDAWPTDLEVVERIDLRVCQRRGAASDIIADRCPAHRYRAQRSSSKIDTPKSLP